MEIIKEPNPILYQRSKEANAADKANLKLLNEMFSYVKEHSGEAIGLSAVQVGIPKRMCAIRFKVGNKNIAYKLINPRIIKRSPMLVEEEEGCLSTNEKVIVKRNSSVTVMAYDTIQGRTIIIEATGLLARCLQHEIDHMDGILITKK